MLKYICIEGIIGSGKTTLCESLAMQVSSLHNVVVLKEKFEDNKLLELFYKYPEKYNFLTEYSFLIDRFHQIHRHFMSYNNCLTISDFSFRKCLWFAENNLSDTEYKEYKKQFFQLEKDLSIHPDILIFLDVKPQQAYSNVQKRGREMEKRISIEYLEKLYTTYQKNISKSDYPLISIPVKNYDDVVTEVLQKILSV